MESVRFLSHPNVMGLLGVVMAKPPEMIVLPLKSGNLLQLMETRAMTFREDKITVAG